MMEKFKKSRVIRMALTHNLLNAASTEERPDAQELQVRLAIISEKYNKKVPDEETKLGGYYFPHRHVIKKGTTRIRPVFDALAAGNNGLLLDLCLETGPNLIELIPNILLPFKQRKIGVISDIRKAFWLRELRISRWVFRQNKENRDLSFHVFVDASQNAYTAVLFAQMEKTKGVYVQLIGAKSRVAPVGKTISHLVACRHYRC